MRFSIAAVLSLATIAMAITPNVAGAKSVGKADGSQFITGGCTSDADCSSACCANASNVGVCSAEAAQFQNGKSGCNFVDPNAAATIAAAQAQVKKQGFRMLVRKEVEEVEEVDEEEENSVDGEEEVEQEEDVEEF